MAAVFGHGSRDITAPATIAVKSELPGDDVVPLWLPNGCSFGAAEVDTTEERGRRQRRRQPVPVGPPSPSRARPPRRQPPGRLGDRHPEGEQDQHFGLDEDQPPTVVFELTIGEATWQHDITGTWTDTPSGNNEVWTLQVDIDSDNVTEADGAWTVPGRGNGTDA